MVIHDFELFLTLVVAFGPKYAESGSKSALQVFPLPVFILEHRGSRDAHLGFGVLGAILLGLRGSHGEDEEGDL